MLKALPVTLTPPIIIHKELREITIPKPIMISKKTGPINTELFNAEKAQFVLYIDTIVDIIKEIQKKAPSPAIAKIIADLAPRKGEISKVVPIPRTIENNAASIKGQIEAFEGLKVLVANYIPKDKSAASASSSSAGEASETEEKAAT